MRLLLLSNSTLAGEKYLSFCKDDINKFLKDHQVNKVAFIPYAAIRYSYDEYLRMVTEGLSNDDISITGTHQVDDQKKLLGEVDAIIVAGGNTFHLLHELYRLDLIEEIRNNVLDGTSYVGWSAGSNIASPTIRTTNDMPIVFPPSFDALNLVPFQINPHYIHGNPPGHNGETREERLTEYLEKNQASTVIGLREGTMLTVHDDRVTLVGDLSARLFQYNNLPKELSPNDDINFLMQITE